MKKKAFKLASLIVALIAAVALTVGYVFAWFFDKRDADFSLNGHSAGAYFDSGDGSKEKPFVIANPTHMHNLAVLQNTGRFSTGGVQKQYYFEIKKTIDEIDMSSVYIPPIGNDEYPFIGIFNGNGKTLSNLKVTTNKSLLGENYPIESSEDYAFSRAVGLFGMTGGVSDISNVILENPLVDVANTDTKYFSTDAGGIKAAQQVAGIAVGFVAGKCSSIGVRAVDEGAALHLKVNGYSTFNSILGALDENVTSSVTGGGAGSLGTGGSGSAFGATFDIASMLDRLYEIYKGKYGVAYKKGNKNEPTADSSVMLPTIDTQNAVPVPGEGAQLPFTVDQENSLYYNLADDGETIICTPDAKEVVSDQNIGYFLGNQNKFDTKLFTFIDRMVPPLTTNYQGKVFIKGSYSDTIDLYLDDDTGEPYILDSNNVKQYVTIQQDSDGDYVYNGQKLSYNKDLDWRTYKSNNVTTTNIPAWFYTFDTVKSDNAGNGCYGSQSFRELTDAEFAELPANVKNLLPAVGSQKTFTTIRISQGGVSTMNYGNTEKSQWSYHGQISWMGNTYGKGFRGNDGNPVDEQGNVLTDDNDQWGNQKNYNAYTKGVALPNSSIWFKPAQMGKLRFIMYSQSDGDGFTLDKIVRTNADKDNPFYVDTDFNVHGGDVEAETIIQQRIPAGILFYYEYNFTAEEVEAGNVEFMLQKNGSNGAHFIYLDVGASATEEVIDTSTIDREKSVSAVDFIYDGVEIKQGNPADDAADATIKVGDFIIKTSGEEELYEASKTSVYFQNLSQIFKLVFLRLYSGSDSHTDKTKTICLEQSNPVPDKNSDIKATFATYVCPEISGGSGTVGGGGGTVTPNPGPDDPVAVTSVSISGAPATLAVGGKATLSATVTPSNATDKTVTWTSSNGNIAEVDGSGNVTAKAAGSVTITATAGGKSDSVTINVEASQYHSGTYTLNAESTDSMVTNNGATINGSTWVLGGNAQTVNLALNVQEGKVITISVKGRRNSDKAEGINVYLGESNSGTKLGTIDLTSTEGEGIGTVQYTATADGYVHLALGRSAAGGTILSEITVTISDEGTVTPTPTVSGVSVTPTTASVEVGGTTNLNASVTMSDGSAYSGSTVWTSSDTSVATVENGVVTGVKAGTATITATAGGKSDSVEITVTDSSSSGGTDLLTGFTTPSSNGSNFIDNDYLSVKSSAKAEQITLTDSAFDMSFPNAVRSSGNKNTLTFTAKQDITLTVYYCSTNGTTIKNNTIDVGYPSGVTGNDTVSDNYIHKLVVTLQSGQSLTIASTSDRTCLLALFAE